MDAGDLLTSFENGVLALVLNRPTHRNALSPEMALALTGILREAQANPAVRCITITGAGDHFTAGGDVQAFSRMLDQSGAERSAQFGPRIEKLGEMVEAFVAFDRPIVARCRGAVAGAGIMFALVADVVLADETATFVFAHQRIGLTPDGGVSWLLPRVVGLRQAKLLILSAAMVDSARAERIGLVTSLHPTAELDAATAKVAAAFARAPQTAMKTAKRMLNQSLETPLAAQLVAETAGIVACVGQDDFAEGVSAFMEKRGARFPSAR
jgi:2-(1,2-epoxy-1,2-dihydrophenyl)acetyl-CoA isomerase